MWYCFVNCRIPHPPIPLPSLLLSHTIPPASNITSLKQTQCSLIECSYLHLGTAARETIFWKSSRGSRKVDGGFRVPPYLHSERDEVKVPSRRWWNWEEKWYGISTYLLVFNKGYLIVSRITLKCRDTSSKRFYPLPLCPFVHPLKQRTFQRCELHKSYEVKTVSHESQVPKFHFSVACPKPGRTLRCQPWKAEPTASGETARLGECLRSHYRVQSIYIGAKSQSRPEKDD